jgi:MSHA biogenesis protein MshO
MVDIANTALLRMARDIRTAVPNSLRVVSASGTVGHCGEDEACYLEYLPIEDGGRYRESQRSDPACTSYPDDNGTPGCNILSFTQDDTSFDVLGPAVKVASGQSVVIYNLGIEGADVWAGDNRSEVDVANSIGCAGSGSACTLAFESFKFPFESPGRRFYLAGAPVTFACSPAGGQLHRISGYTLQSDQPNETSEFGAVSPRLLANHVTKCSFVYEPGASQSMGQLTLRIQISQNGETVTLYREVTVNNDA